MKRTISSALFVIAFAGMYAQQNEKSIEEVSVQGRFLNLPIKKVNENVTVITREQLNLSPSKSVEEVLAQFTGVDIRRRGGNGVQADITLRGSTFEQVLILVNGVRMSDSQTGHNSMNVPFDLSSVERIEIVKGPSARSFGQSAYAGVINIITKPAAQQGATVSASAGDFGTWSLGLGVDFGTEKFSNFIQVGSSASEGYRHNTDYKINNVFYQTRAQVGETKLNLQAGIQEKKFGANGFYATPAATEQYEETQASVVSVSAKRDFDQLNLNSNIYWRRGQDMYEYIRNKPQIYRNMHIGNNVGAEVNGTYRWAAGSTGLGADVRKEFLSSNNLGDRERFITQLLAEHHFSFLNDKLQVSPGISWANYSGGENYFYPGIDAGFEFNDNHKIFGNVAKVNRVPTFTDLYYTSKTEAGNPNLKPEHALSAELGYRFQRPNFLAKVSGFLRDSENSIDWVKANSTAIWKAENIGEIKTRGVEVEMEQKFNSFVRLVSVGYTFLDSEHQQPNQLMSRYQLENLKHQFVAKLENQFTSKISSQLVYRYNERISTGNYQLLDARINFNYNPLNLYVLVNNLTNTKYTETFGVPMPSRWFHVGVSYRVKM